MGEKQLTLLALAAPLLVALPSPIAAQDGPPATQFDTAIGEAKSSMMADSAAALEYAREAKALVEGTGDEAEKNRLTAQWLEAEALMRLNRADEAAGLIEDALSAIERRFNGSKLHADLLRSKATLSVNRSEYGGALSSFLAAHRLYEALGEDRSRAIVLQNIGSLYSDARDYERVLDYYRQARAAFPEDASLALSAHNNTGNALKELGEFEEAEEEFRAALAVAEQMDSPMLEARILTNIASTQFLAGEFETADRTIETGLRIADASAVDWQPFLYGVKAQIALAMGNLPSAEEYLTRTFRNEDISTTSPFFRDFHDTASKVYAQTGDYRLANAHLTAFHRIDAQAKELSAAANNALLAARFDAANRDLQISKLSLEKEANEANLNAAQNQVILLSLTMGLAIIAFLGAMFGLRTVSRSRRSIKEANEKLTHVIQHDGLTGLCARGHFRDLLEHTIAGAKSSGQSAILGFVDLDRFKQVNDVHGHAAGDQLLAQFATRFRSAAGDDAVIGRLGGDEFAIIMPSGMSMDEAVELSECIIHDVSLPYLIEDAEIHIGASIGLAEMIGESSPSVYMTNADLALYTAKDRGRGTCVVYETAMREQLEDRSSLENDLEAALENDELSILYQPIVRGVEGEVIAYEALMRWDHPERGSVPPDVFIPLAEDARLIERIGAWMLRETCSEAMNWPDNVKLSVNISTLQMSEASFLNTVAQALAASGFEPSRLILELTESLVLDMNTDLERLLKSLTDLGVSFALDDFGRGYSSLNYIEQMDFSMIKIDREFVRAATAGSQRSQAVVSAIVALAQSLEMDVTAEGIEAANQAEQMAELGCTCFQGFHFGRPAPSVAKPSDSDTGKAKRAAA